jgi:hypothetical protein
MLIVKHVGFKSLSRRLSIRDDYIHWRRKESFSPNTSLNDADCEACRIQISLSMPFSIGKAM